MGCENGAIFGDPIVNEGLWVFCLVGRDELKGLAEKREAKVSRWQMEFPAVGGAEEMEN